MLEQGAHYKTVPGEQHHERALRLKLNWYAGNITKYAERAEHKGQLVEDLIKVLDYDAMWLESLVVNSEQHERLLAIVTRLRAKLNERADEPTRNYVNQDLGFNHKSGL